MIQVLDREKLSKALKTKRVVEMGITLREAAKKSKVSFSTLSRMENKFTHELDSFLKACMWLNIPACEFISDKPIKK